MERETLRQQIERATKHVDARPSWKQDILARSSQPTLSVPRTPVNNQSRSASAQSHKGS
jgi:hypothetical protein